MSFLKTLSATMTGILAGLFGIGGGAVIVPVPFEVFRLVGVPEAVRMQLCIGTSLAIIVPTAVSSYRAHKARGFVLREVTHRWRGSPSARLSRRWHRPTCSRRRSW